MKLMEKYIYIWVILVLVTYVIPVIPTPSTIENVLTNSILFISGLILIIWIGWHKTSEKCNHTWSTVDKDFKKDGDYAFREGACTVIYRGATTIYLACKKCGEQHTKIVMGDVRDDPKF